MSGRKQRPALTPENRENQLIDLAYSVVEDRLRDGKVSDSLLAQIFRMGSTRERLEKERLRAQNQLAAAKTKAIESSDKIEALYAEAMNALKVYAGQSDDDECDV